MLVNCISVDIWVVLSPSVYLYFCIFTCGQAIEQLIDYLDQNLLTLYTYLLRRNFKILLAAIWQECLEELQDVIRVNDEVFINNYVINPSQHSSYRRRREREGRERRE